MNQPAPEPRLYDELVELWLFLSPPEEYVDEVASFRRRFERHGVRDGARILHLGSGGGSIDFHLKATYRVTGVDISPAMIAHARRINPEVEYVEGDLRTVRLGRTFDAVLLHDAISYMTSIDELESAYRTAAAHLRPGGVMVTLPEEIPSRVDPAEADVTTRTLGERTVTTIEIDYDDDPDDHRFETVYLFIIRDAGGFRVEVDRHVHGVFEIDEFTAAMSAAGFDPTVEPWELSDWTPGREMPLVTAVLRTG